VRFVVITAETMKITVFWSVVQCSLEDYYWYFERIHCLHLQCRRVGNNVPGYITYH
jgi:hypothetical protein